MKQGQKANQWRLHSAAKLKEGFHYLMEDFDTIYNTIANHPRTSSFRSLGSAISVRIRVLREYYPDESEIFISLYQTLYERWKKENEVFYTI